jgi:hypothetical protein
MRERAAAVCDRLVGALHYLAAGAGADKIFWYFSILPLLNDRKKTRRKFPSLDRKLSL